VPSDANEDHRRVPGRAEMETQNIRKCNLSLLIGFCATQTIFGEKVGIDKSTINYLMSGKTGKISDRRARQIENKLVKPKGWMDRDNYNQNITASEWKTISILRRLDVAQTETFLSSLALFSRIKRPNNA
jgi:hypothetical protein